MKKKKLVLVLAIFFTGSVFSQTDDRIHWVSAEANFNGMGIRYEYILSPDISIGANIYFNETFVSGAAGINVIGCFYPLKKRFFVELGIGYGNASGGGEITIINNTTNERSIYTEVTTSGFIVTPGFGWRIKLNSSLEGLFIQPGLKLPTGMGQQKPMENNSSGSYNPNTHTYSGQIGLSAAFVFYICAGYSFNPFW